MFSLASISKEKIPNQIYLFYDLLAIHTNSRFRNISHFFFQFVEMIQNVIDNVFFLSSKVNARNEKAREKKEQFL